MLIKCPECDLQVSDKALACPHCGYPMQPKIKPRRSRTPNKRRRLPNGFGQISELKGRKLNKPFRAMITTGKDDKGRPICKLLKPQAFFTTYNEAYEALINYNKNPYDQALELTFKEVYEKWFEYWSNTVEGKGTINNMKSSYNYCSMLKNMRFVDIKTRHLKACLSDGTYVVNNKERKPTPCIQVKMKTLFNLLFDYAVENEIIEHNYARDLHLPKNIAKEGNKTKKPHIAFSEDEIQTLWYNMNNDSIIKMILIQTYMGWRPTELIGLKVEDVDIENGYIIGGIKSEAGKNRIVPIHTKIYELVKEQYDTATNNNWTYLFEYAKSGNWVNFQYHTYKYRFIKIVKKYELNENHRCHDPRMTFTTKAKKYNLDEYAIKYLIGHAISDITEKIYTERENSWLKEEIEKIK